MFELEGKYGKAKILQAQEKVEQECISQIHGFLNSPIAEGCNVSVMPDCHSGKGSCIGYTQTLKGKVCPNTVGVDINCGMLVYKISKKAGDKLFKRKEDLARLDKLVRENIPMGMNHRREQHELCKHLIESRMIYDTHADVNADKELLALGTVGGGNHYFEIDIDSNGDYYLVVHTGSRHLGLAIANYWQNKAIEHCNSNKPDREALVAKLKAEGREKDIEAELKKLSAPEKIPNDLAYLEGEDFNKYLHDIEIASAFARLNRQAIIEDTLKLVGIKKKDILETFETVHNYIDTDQMILRKGAIDLSEGRKAIIPISMATGALIVIGKGNKEYNCSGPHGAGRLMSRKAARESLKMEDFKAAMKGVYTTSVSVDTIDEAPAAYKPIEDITDNIKELCDIVEVIKPIWNIKAGEKA